MVVEMIKCEKMVVVENQKYVNQLRLKWRRREREEFKKWVICSFNKLIQLNFIISWIIIKSILIRISQDDDEGWM